MIELLHQIEQIDTQIFLFFNGFHNVYWDYFMMIFSDRFVWVPFYASFIFVLLKNSIRLTKKQIFLKIAL